MERKDQIKFLDEAEKRAEKRAVSFASNKDMQDAVRKYDHLLDRNKPQIING